MFKSLASIVGAVALGLGLLGAGAAHAQAGPAVLGGGSGIIIDNQFECTLTTIGNDGAGRLVGLTAGHCGNRRRECGGGGEPGARTGRHVPDVRTRTSTMPSSNSTAARSFR